MFQQWFGSKKHSNKPESNSSMTTRRVASEFGWQSGSESDDDGADCCAGIEDEAGEEGSRTVWPFSVPGITRWLYSLLGCHQPAGEWHVWWSAASGSSGSNEADL